MDLMRLMPTVDDQKDRVRSIVRQYAALEGKPRSQTHRNALACTAMDLLVWIARETASRTALRVPPPGPLFKLNEQGGYWPPEFTIDRKWAGRCLHCKEAGRIGEKVRWNKRKRQNWVHVACCDPSSLT